MEEIALLNPRRRRGARRHSQRASRRSSVRRIYVNARRSHRRMRRNPRGLSTRSITGIFSASNMQKVAGLGAGYVAGGLIEQYAGNIVPIRTGNAIIDTAARQLPAAFLVSFMSRSIPANVGLGILAYAGSRILSTVLPAGFRPVGMSGVGDIGAIPMLEDMGAITDKYDEMGLISTPILSEQTV